MRRRIALSARVLVLVVVVVTGAWLGEDGSSPVRSLQWLALDAALGLGLIVWLAWTHRRLIRHATDSHAFTATK